MFTICTSGIHFDGLTGLASTCKKIGNLLELLFNNLYIGFMQTMKQWFAEFSDEQKNLVLRDFLVCMLNSREHEYLKGHGDLTVLQKKKVCLSCLHMHS